MKKTTIHDIANDLNINFSTVARALNNHPAISALTKLAVQESAKKLNYRQNKIASSLRSGKTNVVGIIIPNLFVNFFSSVVSEIEKVMNTNGYSILLYQSNESPVHESKGIETFLQSRVDGIIASVSAETSNLEQYREIISRNIPLVFFDRIIDELAAPAVSIDDYKAGFMATEHLIRQGYRHIAHITLDKEVSVFTNRFNGYADALKMHHLAVSEELIFKGPFSAELGRSVVKTMIEKQHKFDAIFSSEDITAMGAIQQLLSYKISIPEDVGVIGFDNEPFGSLSSPMLSTIDQQNTRMGAEAANLLLKLCTGNNFTTHPERIVLDPILMIRQSSNRRSAGSTL